MNTTIRQAGVYEIRNTVTDRVYIGSTIKGLDRRWNEHLSRLRTGTHYNKTLLNDWRAFGEDAFTFTILEVLDDPDLARIREQYWLDTSLAPRYNNRARASGLRGRAGRHRPLASSSSEHSVPQRYRAVKMYTLDPQTLVILQELIAAGLYPNASRALDAAAQRLKRYHQLRAELAPTPPDPGEIDDDDDRRQNL